MTTETETYLEITMTKIGSIEKGCDGAQKYLLLKCLNDDLSEDDAWKYLHPLVYRDTNRAGGYFCHIVETIKKSDNEVICIVHHDFNN
jgi:hypothetical protein